MASLGVREQARPEGRENAVDQLGDQLCAVLGLGKDEDHACGLLVLLAGDNDAGDRVAVLARRQGDPLTGNRGCWLDYALEAAVIEVVLDPQSPRHAALGAVHLPPDVGGDRQPAQFRQQAPVVGTEGPGAVRVQVAEAVQSVGDALRVETGRGEDDKDAAVAVDPVHRVLHVQHGSGSRVDQAIRC